jgi:hypothetical protein
MKFFEQMNSPFFRPNQQPAVVKNPAAGASTHPLNNRAFHLIAVAYELRRRWQKTQK